MNNNIDILEDGDVILFFNEDSINTDSSVQKSTYSHKGRIRDGNRIIFIRLYERESTKGKKYLKGNIFKVMEIKKQSV